MKSKGVSYGEWRNRVFWFAASVLLIVDGAQRLVTGDASGWTVVFPVAELVAGAAGLISVALGLRAAWKNSESRTQGA